MFNNYIVLPSKNLNPDLAAKFDPIIHILQVEFNRWLKKKECKTSMCVMKCKIAMELAKQYCIEGDLPTMYRVIQNDISIDILKKCVYQNKSIQIQLLESYLDLVNAMLELKK